MLLEAFDTVENQVLSPMASFVFVLRWGGALGGRGSPQCGGPGVVRIESFSCARGGGEGAVVAIWKARFWTRWAFTRAVCWLTLLIIRP